MSLVGTISRRQVAVSCAGTAAQCGAEYDRGSTERLEHPGSASSSHMGDLGEFWRSRIWADQVAAGIEAERLRSRTA
jgi:hypothetical protein